MRLNPHNRRQIEPNIGNSENLKKFKMTIWVDVETSHQSEILHSLIFQCIHSDFDATRQSGRVAPKLIRLTLLGFLILIIRYINNLLNILKQHVKIQLQQMAKLT